MSPASYRAAPPRVVVFTTVPRRGVAPAQLPWSSPLGCAGLVGRVAPCRPSLPALGAAAGLAAGPPPPARARPAAPSAPRRTPPSRPSSGPPRPASKAFWASASACLSAASPVGGGSVVVARWLRRPAAASWSAPVDSEDRVRAPPRGVSSKAILSPYDDQHLAQQRVRSASPPRDVDRLDVEQAAVDRQRSAGCRTRPSESPPLEQRRADSATVGVGR